MKLNDETLVHPAAWWWVGCTLFLIIAFLIWATLGKIEVTVFGWGMMVPRDGEVVTVTAMGNGTVAELIKLNAGRVKKGELLARVSNPDLQVDLDYLNKIYLDNEQMYQAKKSEYEAKKAWLQSSYQQKMTMLADAVKNKEQRMNTLKSLYGKKLELYKKKFLTIIDMEKGREEYIQADEAFLTTKLSLEELPVKQRSENNELEEKLKQNYQQYLASKHELDIKMNEKFNGTTILSPVDGELINQRIATGDFVRQHDALFTLMTAGSTDELQAVVFVSHVDGKKIHQGNRVYILPENLNPYVSGYLKGEVERVSAFPASKESAYAYVGNSNLVDEYFKSGVPFMVKIRLLRRDDKQNAYWWTSRRGNKEMIKAGTLASARLIVRESSLWGMIRQ